MAAVSPAEQEVRKLSMELRYFEQTAEALQQRLSMMNAALTDLTYANMTLESIEKEKENAEMMVPIGGSSYINVRLATPDKVVVGMGAGVSVEKTLPEAKDILKQRLDEMENTRVQAQQQLSQVVDRINQGRTRIESLLSAAVVQNANKRVEKVGDANRDNIVNNLRSIIEKVLTPEEISLLSAFEFCVNAKSTLKTVVENTRRSQLYIKAIYPEESQNDITN